MSQPSTPDRRRADDGFSLLEAIVAAVVLGITASAVAGLTIRGLEVAQDATQRTTAANLAATRIETVRGTRALDIPNGRTQFAPTTISGTDYTIVQDAAFVALDAAADACQGSTGTLAYKRVTVTVTWPNMGATRPVRSDTLRSLGFGADGLDPTKGSAGIKVLSSSGVGVPGISVTVQGSSGAPAVGTQTTGADGCLVFVGVPPGNYVALLGTSGYVDAEGRQSFTSGSFGVTAAQLTTTNLSYDRPGQLSIVLAPPPRGLVPPPGFVPPANLGATLESSLWTGLQRRPFPDCADVTTDPQGCVVGDAATRTATALFPAAYTAWTGTCSDARPSAPAPLQTVPPGGTASVAAPLGAITVRSVAASAGQDYWAVHASGDTACPAGASYYLGKLPPVGATVNIALPYGTWYLQRSRTGSLVPSQKVVVAPSPAVASASVAS